MPEHHWRALVAAALVLCGCGGPPAKSVSWEEEVRLGNGEMIWVRRTDSFLRRSEPGNPLQMGWWPDVRSYEFDYRGRHYAYRTDPNESLGAMLLFARGEELVIVDSTRACGKPGYAEFRWSGQAWERREPGPDLIGQPRNLMRFSSPERPWGEKIGVDAKQALDASPRGPRQAMALEPALVAGC